MNTRYYLRVAREYSAVTNARLTLHGAAEILAAEIRTVRAAARWRSAEVAGRGREEQVQHGREHHHYEGIILNMRAARSIVMCSSSHTAVAAIFTTCS